MIKNQLNKEGKRHGYWEHYTSNGKLWAKGNYKGGKEHGYWESNWVDGKLRKHFYL